MSQALWKPLCVGRGSKRSVLESQLCAKACAQRWHAGQACCANSCRVAFDRELLGDLDEEVGQRKSNSEPYLGPTVRNRRFSGIGLGATGASQATFKIARVQL